MKGMRCEKQGEGPLLKPPRQPVYARVRGLHYTTVLCCSVTSQAEKLLRPPHIMGQVREGITVPVGSERPQSRLPQLLSLYIAVHALPLWTQHGNRADSDDSDNQTCPT